MGNLKAGLSCVDITPPVGTPLEGYIERREVSQGVHDRLFAKAVVLSDGETNKVAIVSVDLSGVGRRLVEFARRGVESKTGIQGSNVMIAATHTHSGPRGVVDFFTGEEAFSKGFFDRRLSEKIGNAIVKAVVDANNKLREASMGLGRGTATGICSNRRTPEGPFDPELGVIRIDSATKRQLMGCVINYSCHPTVLGPSNLLISADFPAYIYDTMETSMRKPREEKIVVSYLNGASGNVSTRFTRREATFAEAERIGRALGSEALKILRVTRSNNDTTISTANEIIKLRQRKLPPLDSVKSNLKSGMGLLTQLRARGAPEGEIRVVESLTEGARGLLAAYDYASKFEGREFEVEIQVFKLGDTVTLCAVPAELFVELGLEIKRKLKRMNPLVVGYANGFIGYVLTEEAHREGGYESLSTFLEANAGTRMVEEVEKLARSLSLK
nr:neutral/alkaline non-lysosomal ceramidase N-terminal domain-containing protein [Candidatus Njordarchaeota archaeon]